MSGKTQILNPLSVLIKLGMLAYFKKNTKLCVHNNIIEFQLPDKIQWLKRTVKGDSKNDLRILYNPILKAIEWYIIDNNKNNNNTDCDTEEFVDSDSYKNLGLDIDLKVDTLTAVKNIIKHAIIGLNNLESTYKEKLLEDSKEIDTLASLTIKFLKSNLKLSLDMNFNKQKLILFNEIEDIEENVLNHLKIKDIWQKDKIKLISGQFDMLETYKDDSQTSQHLLKSMLIILNDIDIKFQKLIKDMNSTL